MKMAWCRGFFDAAMAKEVVLFRKRRTKKLLPPRRNADPKRTPRRQNFCFFLQKEALALRGKVAPELNALVS
jgi:hypothetical protein